MIKFGRKFRLTIDMNDGSGQIVIQNPFTIDFSIERSANSNLNEMILRIYNLSLLTRSRIRQDEFLTNSNHLVTLEAGYDQLSIIFKGFIRWAYNGRERENVTTTIHAQDGGNDVINTQSTISLAAGTSVQDAFKALVGAFPNLELGAIGQFDGKFNRGVIMDGNTWNLLKTYAPAQAFIDKGKIFLLKGNEVINSGEIPIINSDTGLLETPRRRNAYLEITTMFEPRITVGQILQLQSSIEPTYDGQYKVIGVNHQGIISDAVGGDLRSKFYLLLPMQAFGKGVVTIEQSTSTVAAKS